MTLKAVIIGCGNIAGGYDLHTSANEILTHAKAYRKNKQVKLEAACDIDPVKLETFRKQWDIPHGFTNIDTMMKMVSPEIVSICSPSEAHYSNLMEVTGFPVKAVICEKPLAMSVAEATRMVERCKAKHIILAVNYSRRWMPHFVSISNAVRQGKFGEIQTARFLYTKGVFHSASHFINLAQFWFGPLKSVEVFSGAPWGAYDVRANFFARFEKCHNVVFQNCNDQWYEVTEMDIICRWKRIEILRGGGTIRETDTITHPVLSGTDIFASNPQHTQFGENRSMAHLLDNILKAIAESKPLAMSAEEALDTVRICEQVREKTVQLRGTL